MHTDGHPSKQIVDKDQSLHCYPLQSHYRQITGQFATYIVSQRNGVCILALAQLEKKHMTFRLQYK